jgi:hypothetical protein
MKIVEDGTLCWKYGVKKLVLEKEFRKEMLEY